MRRRLTSIDEMVVASPAYMARRGTHPSALSGHSLPAVSDGSSRMWEFADANGLSPFLSE
jgi:hypothetical protein